MSRQPQPNTSRAHLRSPRSELVARPGITTNVGACGDEIASTPDTAGGAGGSAQAAETAGKNGSKDGAAGTAGATGRRGSEGGAGVILVLFKQCVALCSIRPRLFAL